MSTCNDNHMDCCLRLYSKSKVVLSVINESLLSSGGSKNASGQISYPLHPKSCDKDADGQTWSNVHEVLVSAPSGDPVRSEYISQESGTSAFRPEIYFKFLDCTTMGQSVLFGQRIPSTVHIIDRLAPALPENIGIIAVAAQQTLGKGRSGNTWESPLGCAMCSFPLAIPLTSRLGQGLSFVQHLVATACVLAVRNTPGYENVDLRIKWPNDILTSDKVKVGGVLVATSIFRDKAYCNIGIGFNVTNSKPTTCVNALIQRASIASNIAMEAFTIEKFLARTLTELEKLIRSFAAIGPSAFLPTYLKFWLHANQSVDIHKDETSTKTKNEVIARGQIVGLDEHGFLQVKVGDENWSVQSDGNRFDMMQNLLFLRTIPN